MKLLPVVAALFLSSSVPAFSAPYDYNPEAVVYLDCKTGTGTAIKIGKDKYVSAAHVTEFGGGDCKVGDTPIKAVRQAPGKDFVTFTGPASNHSMSISCSGFKAGKSYLAIGYAFGERRLTEEPLIAFDVKDYGLRQFVGEVIPGMSGGPVIDKAGRVVGIVNMRWPARSLELKDTEICK